MRISNRMMTRNYLSQATGAQSRYNETLAKTASQRAFDRISDDVSAAAKAMRIRSNLYKNAQMTENTLMVQEELDVAESNMKTAKDIMQTGHVEALDIENGIYTPEDRLIIAEQYKSYQQQLMQVGNAIYGEHYVFSGIQSYQAPYNLNDNGEYCYNTIPVAKIGKDINSTFVYGTELAGVSDPTDLTGASIKGSTPGVDFDGCIFVKGSDGNFYEVDDFVDNGDGTFNAETYNGGTAIPGGPIVVDSKTKLYAGEMSSNPHSSVLPANSSDVTAVNMTDPNDLSTATVVNGEGLLSPNAKAYIKDNDNYYYQVASYTDNGDGTGSVNYVDINGENKTMNTNSATKYYTLEHAVADTDGNVKTDAGGDTLFEYNKVPYSDRQYVDAGFGLSVDSFTGLDKNTAIKTSVSGLEAYGYGTRTVEYATGDGVIKTYEVPNNVYELYGEMSKALEENDLDKFSALDIHLVEKTDELVKNISDLGIGYKYLDSNLVRLENESMTLEELRGKVEGIDNVTEITNLYNDKYAWELTLQFGSKYLPQSLMDYV
jgi:flagellin-like hook-associated protein FlgL